MAELYPTPAAALARPGAPALHAGARRRRRPRVPGPAPRRVAGDRAADRRPGRPRGRPRRRLPAARPGAVPRVVRRRAPGRPSCSGGSSTGCPELFRDEVAGAQHIAVPGCYPTAGSLALAPLVRAGLVEPPRASSSTRPAGCRAPVGRRSPTPRSAPSTRTSPAYGLLDGHRHTPEIEQNLGRRRCASPRTSSPMNRGILATCYARPTGATSTDELLAVLHEAYDDEPFVVVRDRLAQHQGDARLEHRPRHRAARRAHRLRGRALCHRQPGEGRVGPGRPVRQPHPRPRRDVGPAARIGLDAVSVTAAKGFVAAGVAGRHQGLGRPRPLAGGHRRRASRCRLPPCSRPTR